MSPIITPRCERCGGLRPEYARANRRRLGAVAYGLMVCCCDQPVFSRWRKCGSLTGEIYTRDSDRAPNPFKRISDGLCWSRVSTGQALPVGATLLDPADWTTDAGCCVCEGCDEPLTAATATIVIASVDVTQCMRDFGYTGSAPGGDGGIGQCFGDMDDSDGSWKIVSGTVSPSVNDTYVSAASCSAGGNYGTMGSANFQRWTDFNCTNPLGGGSIIGTDRHVRMSITANGICVYGIFLGNPTSNSLTWFYGTASIVDGKCFDSLVISNLLGSGGTATIIFS